MRLKIPSKSAGNNDTRGASLSNIAFPATATDVYVTPSHSPMTPDNTEPTYSPVATSGGRFISSSLLDRLLDLSSRHRRPDNDCLSPTGSSSTAVSLSSRPTGSVSPRLRLPAIPSSASVKNNNNNNVKNSDAVVAKPLPSAGIIHGDRQKITLAKSSRQPVTSPDNHAGQAFGFRRVGVVSPEIGTRCGGSQGGQLPSRHETGSTSGDSIPPPTVVIVPPTKSQGTNDDSTVDCNAPTDALDNGGRSFGSQLPRTPLTSSLSRQTSLGTGLKTPAARERLAPGNDVSRMATKPASGSGQPETTENTTDDSSEVSTNDVDAAAQPKPSDVETVDQTNIFCSEVSSPANRDSGVDTDTSSRDVISGEALVMTSSDVGSPSDGDRTSSCQQQVSMMHSKNDVSEKDAPTNRKCVVSPVSSRKAVGQVSCSADGAKSYQQPSKPNEAPSHDFHVSDRHVHSIPGCEDGDTIWFQDGLLLEKTQKQIAR